MTHLLALLLLATSPHAHAIPREKTVTYHVQIGDWPDTLRPRIERVVEELTSPGSCWTIHGHTVEKQRLPQAAPAGTAGTAGTSTAGTRCNRFVRFDSEEALRPWKQDVTDAKYYLYYEEENGIARIRIKQFVWDGEKLVRVANSGFQRDLTDEKGIRDLLVSWTLK